MTEKIYRCARPGHHQLPRGRNGSDANIISVSQREFEQIYPKPGWVEHDPMEIWATQSSTLVEVLAKADISSIKLQLSVLRTSVKPLLSGKKKPASLSITPLSGSAVVPQKSASI